MLLGQKIKELRMENGVLQKQYHQECEKWEETMQEKTSTVVLVLEYSMGNSAVLIREDSLFDTMMNEKRR